MCTGDFRCPSCLTGAVEDSGYCRSSLQTCPMTIWTVAKLCWKKGFLHETVDCLNFNICLKEPSLNLLGFLEFLPHSRALLDQREERVCHLSPPESNSSGVLFCFLVLLSIHLFLSQKNIVIPSGNLPSSLV